MGFLVTYQSKTVIPYLRIRTPTRGVFIFLDFPLIFSFFACEILDHFTSEKLSNNTGEKPFLDLTCSLLQEDTWEVTSQSQEDDYHNLQYPQFTFDLRPFFAFTQSFLSVGKMPQKQFFHMRVILGNRELSNST